jgi:predicted CopG family antitoxin
MKNITTIQVRKETRERLLEIGRKKETYDDLINRLIDFYLKVKEKVKNEEDIPEKG